MVVGVVERWCRVEVEVRQTARSVGPGEQLVVLLDGSSALLVGAREQDRDRVQVIAGQAADPVLGSVCAGVPEDVRARRHALRNSSGKVASDSSGTPSARNPFHVNANVTQRSELSIVACTSAADWTLSSNSVSHARPPAGVSNERNS